MRILTVIVYLAMATLLSACDRQGPASDVNPMLGRECFESLRASLSPGTQYEGIDSIADNRITIRIMNGVEVTTLDCGLNPDGSLQNTGK